MKNITLCFESEKRQWFWCKIKQSLMFMQVIESEGISPTSMHMMPVKISTLTTICKDVDI